MPPLDTEDRALIALLERLRAQDYHFVTTTPATHQRVIARKSEARSLRDIFGWSLPFVREGWREWADLLEAAGMLASEGGLVKSRARVSAIADHLFLHSAFPTVEEDAVFLGPDTSRFAALIQAELSLLTDVRRLVDIGAGAGAGAIVAAGLLRQARITVTDINARALRLARLNAAFAGVEVEAVEGSGLDKVEGDIDLVIANPPYIMDDGARDYRDGGGMHGAQLSLDWALASARRLSTGGHMILYTGVAIIDGRDPLRAALEERLPALGCSLRYGEIDPDVFGEELEKPAYADVDRIAAIGAVIARA